jgi:hypothetical protein
MPKGTQYSIGSEAEQTYNAEGNLQVYHITVTRGVKLFWGDSTFR